LWGRLVVGGVGDDGNRMLHIQLLNAMCKPSFIPISYQDFRGMRVEAEQEEENEKFANCTFQFLKNPLY